MDSISSLDTYPWIALGAGLAWFLRALGPYAAKQAESGGTLKLDFRYIFAQGYGAVLAGFAQATSLTYSPPENATPASVVWGAFVAAMIMAHMADKLVTKPEQKGLG